MPALRAETDDLDLVPGCQEAMAGGDLAEPVAETAQVNLDDVAAAGADEVVMMRLAAEAIADFALTVRESVDHARFVEESERAVYVREPNRRPVLQTQP